MTTASPNPATAGQAGGRARHQPARPGRGDLEQTARHGLGQLTRPYGTVPRRPLEHARFLAGRQEQVAKQSRLGIPAMTHDECLTGFTASGATIYPTLLGMAATFDPPLIGNVGRAIGADMAEAGVHQGLAPVVELIRDYRWGRCEEMYGEDQHLVGEMAEAYVAGLQDAGVYATLKHLAGYSAEELPMPGQVDESATSLVLC